MKAYRDAQISLFQSAVSQVVEQHTQNQILSVGGTAALSRATADHPMLDAVTAYADSASSPALPTSEAPRTLSIADGAKYCVNMSLKLGEALGKALVTGNQSEIARYRDQLNNKFTECDARWAEAALVYADYFVAQGKPIPYKSIKTIPDPVIETLPEKVRVAIVGDWGTGQQAALTVLSQIKGFNPQIIVHLGDVYYAGTQYEYDNYFSGIWSQVFGKSPGQPGSPTLYNLSGNHDMYSGGEAYYKLLQSIGQPASFFVLRNKNWQFLSMDTGLHDANPVSLGHAPTFLDRDEAAWVCDKVSNQGITSKTILFSHHQLFSGYEKIGDSPVNQSLFTQLKDILPKTTMWFWGHEHNLVIFDKYFGIYGRCLGHGAFPVGIDEPPETVLPGVPVMATVHLDKGFAFYRHGYAILDINGPTASVSYYEDSSTATPLYKENIAADGTVAPAPASPAP
jgi:hypothetical protein